MKPLYIFSLFLSLFLSSVEPYTLLSQNLQYQEGSYVDIMKSQKEYDYLAATVATNQPQVRAFIDAMLQDIRNEKDILYSKWCGDYASVSKTIAVSGCACASPTSVFMGWLSKYFYLTITGTVATSICIPTIGWTIANSINTYSQLGVYEEVAMLWEKSLLEGMPNIALYQHPISTRME